ncbi:MAG: hypothetical protein ABIH52_03000 [Candidatus Aenigmatarchaeota archaeon]|nr:hypothetical protein [Nanoarchaeota archaeon]
MLKINVFGMPDGLPQKVLSALKIAILDGVDSFCTELHRSDIDITFIQDILMNSQSNKVIVVAQFLFERDSGSKENRDSLAVLIWKIISDFIKDLEKTQSDGAFAALIKLGVEVRPFIPETSYRFGDCFTSTGRT